MLEAEIIKPDKKRKPISCDDCLLQYTKTEYGILFKNKKLIYFNFAFPDTSFPIVLCHDCLFKNVKKLARGKPIKIKLFSADGEYYCEFS